MKALLLVLEVLTSLLLLAALVAGTYAAYHYTEVAAKQAYFMEECKTEVTKRGDQTPQQVEFFCYRTIYK